MRLCTRTVLGVATSVGGLGFFRNVCLYFFIFYELLFEFLGLLYLAFLFYSLYTVGIFLEAFIGGRVF